MNDLERADFKKLVVNILQAADSDGMFQSYPLTIGTCEHCKSMCAIPGGKGICFRCFIQWMGLNLPKDIEDEVISICMEAVREAQ